MHLLVLRDVIYYIYFVDPMSQFMDTIQTPSNETYNQAASEHIGTDLHSGIVNGNLIL